jgi:hypothetical protein
MGVHEEHVCEVCYPPREIPFKADQLNKLRAQATAANPASGLQAVIETHLKHNASEDPGYDAELIQLGWDAAMSQKDPKNCDTQIAELSAEIKLLREALDRIATGKYFEATTARVIARDALKVGGRDE